MDFTSRVSKFSTSTLLSKIYIQRFWNICTLYSPWCCIRKSYCFFNIICSLDQKRFSQEASLSFFIIDVKSLVSDLSSPFVTNTWFGVLWNFEKTIAFLSIFSTSTFNKLLKFIWVFKNQISFWFINRFIKEEPSTSSSTDISLILLSSKSDSIVESQFSSSYTKS